MDTLERDLLWASVGRILDGDHDRVGAELLEFGWAELLASAPDEAVPAAFETAGARLAPLMLLDDVVLSAVGLPVGCSRVVYPLPARTVAGDLVGSRLEARGVTVGPVETGDAVIVLANLDGSPALVRGRVVGVVIADSEAGLDPFGGAREVSLTVSDSVPVDGDASAVAVDATAAARRAVAHDLTGVAQATLDLALVHAREREQFGRPIGTFQAVQHRCAESHLAIAGARVALDEAWAVPGRLTALLAKLWAGRAARISVRHSLQVLGGIGFTWEHPLHRYLRRAHVLDGLLGSSRQLAAALGAEIRGARAVPRLANL